MKRLQAFVELSRPIFLLGGALLYLLGSVLSDGPLNWTDYAIGQALVTAVQLTAQYTNEHFDLAADRLAGDRRTWLTGGSGVMPAGRLAARTALVAAFVTTAAAIVLIAMVASVSRWAATVGLVALLGAWAYSAPPARLVATPVGVTAASLIVAVLTPLTGALVQGGAPADHLVAVVAPLFLLHHAMLIAFERPDLRGDEASGKRTLSVRIGPAWSARMHGGFLAGAYLALATGLLGPLAATEAMWALSLAPIGLLQLFAFARGSDFLVTTLAAGSFVGTTLGLVLGMS